MESAQASPSEFYPAIRRARLGQLTIYELSENELEVLEKGSPSSTILNFSIFLLSIAISFLVSLLTTTITDNRVYVTFLVITIIGFILGILFLIVWFQKYRSSTNIANQIRNRLPPEGQPSGKPHITVEIVSAQYGMGENLVDVTSIVIKYIDSGPTSFIVCPESFNVKESSPALKRILKVSWKINNKTKLNEFRDGEAFTLPHWG